MTGETGTITCREFQAQLPELIGPGQKLAADPHLVQCPHCRRLLADLKSIAESARQPFPGVEPSEGLREQIESVIWIEGGSREPEEQLE
jgi:hypothetical protein